jgi:hypothetical protein
MGIQKRWIKGCAIVVRFIKAKEVQGLFLLGGIFLLLLMRLERQWNGIRSAIDTIIKGLEGKGFAGLTFFCLRAFQTPACR